MSSEMRKHERFISRKIAFLELTYFNEQKGVTQRVIDCDTLDISSEGLRLKLNSHLEVGTVGDIYIDFEDNENKFFLTIELKWIQTSNQPNCYYAGFMVHEAQGTDYKKWQSMLETYFT